MNSLGPILYLIPVFITVDVSSQGTRPSKGAAYVNTYLMRIEVFWAKSLTESTTVPALIPCQLNKSTEALQASYEAEQSLKHMH